MKKKAFGNKWDWDGSTLITAYVNLKTLVFI